MEWSPSQSCTSVKEANWRQNRGSCRCVWYGSTANASKEVIQTVIVHYLAKDSDACGSRVKSTMFLTKLDGKVSALGVGQVGAAVIILAGGGAQVIEGWIRR